VGRAPSELDAVARALDWNLNEDTRGGRSDSAADDRQSVGPDFMSPPARKTVAA
jgi:hypothetical protein